MRLASFLAAGVCGVAAFPVLGGGCGQPEYVPVISDASQFTSLRALSAGTMNDVWAVGLNAGALAVRHFEGGAWVGVDAPAAEDFDPPVMGAYSLRSIVRAPNGEVWIGGNIDHPVQSFNGYPILARYEDGSWTDHAIIPIPSHPVPPNQPIGGAIEILGAAADGAIFGLGIQDAFLGPFCAIRAAGSSSWEFTTLPMPFNRVQFVTGVYALSSDDAWAVGYGDSGGTPFYPILWHWNGSSWSQVATPVDNDAQTFFRGIDGTSGDDIWIVGHTIDESSQTVPLTLHYDGSSWSEVPVAAGESSRLLGVAAIAPDDVWAFTVLDAPEYYHFDGSGWTHQAQPPIPGAEARFAAAMDAVPGQGAWVVGTARVATNSIIMMSERIDACAAGCSVADLAEPFGQLDFSDVVAFLSAFGAMDDAADIAEPLGQWDFSDVVAFLGAFGAGCP